MDFLFSEKMQNLESIYTIWNHLTKETQIQFPRKQFQEIEENYQNPTIKNSMEQFFFVI